MAPLKQPSAARKLISSAGLIGSHLVEQLLRLGQQVVSVDNFATGHHANLREVEQTVGPDTWRWHRFIQGSIVVDHDGATRRAAASTSCSTRRRSVRCRARSPIRIATHETNVAGFEHAASACDAKVHRFVYASSSSAYGDHEGVPKVKHETGAPLSPHAASKQANKVYESIRRRLAALSLAAALSTAASAQDGAPATIEQVKQSIVAVGTLERTRSPAFTFAGTGFAVGDGLRIATNEHVLPKKLNSERNETLAIAVRAADGTQELRTARKRAADSSHDLALLEIDGTPLPALRLGNSDRVREGETYLFTGFPIGAVLGLYPVTHRTMIAAVTPIAIPAARANQLDARAVRRLTSGSFMVFQLDGTAYPGNSGSPVYHPASGEVVGIVNSVLVKGTKESVLKTPSGITYAIPVQKLKALLQGSS